MSGRHTLDDDFDRVTEFDDIHGTMVHGKLCEKVTAMFFYHVV